MTFDAVVLGKDDFRIWLQRERRPAAIRQSPGLDAFLANGCGACHAIRGTPADGVIGPDLTHFGSRPRLGSGVLVNDREAIERWIRETDKVKPGVHMPAFGMLPSAEVRVMAEYLEALR
jgi:cytochrome c oxidase subunit 2